MLSNNFSYGYFETLCHNAGAIPTELEEMYVAQEALQDWRSEQLKD